MLGVSDAKLRTASRARVKLTMSVKLPSGRLTRYIFGQTKSGIMIKPPKLIWSDARLDFCPSHPIDFIVLFEALVTVDKGVVA